MDQARYAPCVMPHLPWLIRAAAALVGMADAEDAAQEALLRAWHAWPALRDEAAVRLWLLRIVSHVCLDWQRGRFGTERERTAFWRDDLPESLALLGDAGSSDHTARLDLRQAVTALDTPLRVVVILRFYAGLNATEIGAMLAIPTGTVRSRLRRALTLLRDSIIPLASTPQHAAQEAADV
ncbi:MAG: RNA polymerase sigma factor [Ktedonobacterales bacterium]|nr:RNA polymerase sigma factor [Ktedonobacterales bacterium]